MKSNQSKSCYQAPVKNGSRIIFNEKKDLSNSSTAGPVIELEWDVVFKQLIVGLSKLFVAIRFLLFYMVWRPLRSLQLPWMKIGFLSLVAFILFKNDLGSLVNGKPAALTIAKQEDEKGGAGESWFAAIFSSSAKGEKVDLNSADNPYAPLAADNQRDRAVKAYIRRFAKVAVTEMHKFGIPASIKMAQAIIESRSGQSILSQKVNNHFGIKCFSKSCHKGHCSNFGDDHHKDFFRQYRSAWESWRSHSKMIVSGRYKDLLLFGNDYESWAHGLKKLGYATDNSYDKKLINTIEKYQLHLLDNL